MAIWKEQTLPKTDTTPIPPNNIAQSNEPSLVSPLNAGSTSNSLSSSSYRSTAPTAKDSLIAADLTIEGKIQGAGHIRMAGHFKGDINVDGNLTIEPGAKVTGSVRAHTVVIGGELEGNIEAASHVELLESGVLTGDLQAGTFVVASGSRMRGQVSFGWDDTATKGRSTTSISTPKMEVLSSA